MAEEQMIVKADKRKNKLNITIKKMGKNTFVSPSYFKSLNPKDSNDLALLFEDLNLMVGAPIEKAFFKYKENRGDNFIY